MNLKEGTRAGFIIQQARERHYVPIFAEKKNGQLRIFAPEGLPADVQDELNKNEIPCKVLKEKTDIHRQKDSESCPVFSLRDLSQLCQHPELMDEIESHVSDKESGSNSKGTVVEKVFTTYPPRLENSNQSLSFIRQKDSEQQRTVAADLDRRGKIKAVPNSNLPLEKKAANITITDRRLKYEEILYSAVIAKIVGQQKG